MFPIFILSLHRTQPKKNLYININNKMRHNTTDTIYGIRAVMEAIHSGKQLDKVMVKKGLSGELSQELMDLLRTNGLSPQFVPAEKFAQFGNKNHQGVVALLSPIDFAPL